MQIEKWVNLEDVAEHLSISQDTVRTWIKEGKLPVYRAGKRYICTDEWLHSIVDYDILPMLSEYWFDDASKLRHWENILQGVFQ